MHSVEYNRITIQSGDHCFAIYCTQYSLEHRRDEVILWADQLARRLHWRDYESTISPATTAEATERPHALFENRFPTDADK